VSDDQNDERSEGYKKLEEVVVALTNGQTVKPIALRVLLDWFGARARGVRTNKTIRDALAGNNLRIEPDIHADILTMK